MPFGFNTGRLGILNPGSRPKLKPPPIRTRPPAGSRWAFPSERKAIIDFPRRRRRRRTRARKVIPRGFGKAQKSEYDKSFITH